MFIRYRSKLPLPIPTSPLICVSVYSVTYLEKPNPEHFKNKKIGTCRAPFEMCICLWVCVCIYKDAEFRNVASPMTVTCPGGNGSMRIGLPDCVFVPAGGDSYRLH